MTSLAGGARLFMGVAFVVLAFVVVFGLAMSQHKNLPRRQLCQLLIGLFHDDGVDFTSCWWW